ncbi:MAG: SMI1/KNR4 family protein [Pacificimonas sp.]
MDLIVDWEPYLADVPVPTETSIALAEQKAGARFPDDIRPFFSAVPGKTTVPEDLEIGSRTVVLGPLILFTEDSGSAHYSYSFQKALEAMRNWGGNKAGGKLNFLPFADDTENGYFAYDLRAGSGDPGVVYIQTELAPEDDGAILPAATSFTALLKQLK